MQLDRSISTFLFLAAGCGSAELGSGGAYRGGGLDARSDDDASTDADAATDGDVSAEREADCRLLCDMEVACGAVADRAGCLADCLCAEERLRQEVFEAYFTCAAEALEGGCSDFGDCPCEAASGVEPSSTAIGCLAACSARAADCPILDCDAVSGALADDTLEDLAACFEEETCVDAARCAAAVGVSLGPYSCGLAK